MIEQTVQIADKACLGLIARSLAEEMNLKLTQIKIDVPKTDKLLKPFPLGEDGLPTLQTREQIRDSVDDMLRSTPPTYVSTPGRYCNAAMGRDAEILSFGWILENGLYAETIIFGSDPIQVMTKRMDPLVGTLLQDPLDYVFVRYNPGVAVNPDTKMQIIEPLRALSQSMNTGTDFRLVGHDCKGFKLDIPRQYWEPILRPEGDKPRALENCLMSYMNLSFLHNPHMR